MKKVILSVCSVLLVSGALLLGGRKMSPDALALFSANVEALSNAEDVFTIEIHDIGDGQFIITRQTNVKNGSNAINRCQYSKDDVCLYNKNLSINSTTNASSFLSRTTKAVYNFYKETIENLPSIAEILRYFNL